MWRRGALFVVAILLVGLSADAAWKLNPFIGKQDYYEYGTQAKCVQDNQVGLWNVTLQTFVCGGVSGVGGPTGPQGPQGVPGDNGTSTTSLPWDNITSRPTINSIDVTGAVLDNVSNYPATLQRTTQTQSAQYGGTGQNSSASTGFPYVLTGTWSFDNAATFRARLATGTPDGTKFLRDDWSWQVASGGSMIYPGAGVPLSTGSAWGTSYTLVTTLGSPGSNTNIPSEAAVRAAISAAGGMSNLSDDTSPELGGNLDGMNHGIDNAVIGGTTPKAGTFTTLGAGGGGFAVDADGDTTVKSLTVTKQSGVAGDMSLYEANSTDTHGAGFRGPVSITGDGAYRGQFPNARPSSANMVMAWTNAGETGTGTAADPYVQATSWLDLDAYAPLVSPSFTTPTLGVAAATSINKVAITAPATSATLTIADGKTLTASNTITLTGTDTASVAVGTGGTVTFKIASGTSALGTGAISSATCATVVTTSATGTATTDVINWGFNGDPTAVTGYVPLSTGMLTIIAYPSANNVNFKVCNNTASSITPGAITLNWIVVR